MRLLQLQTLMQHTCGYLLLLTATSQKQHKDYANRIYRTQHMAEENELYVVQQQKIIELQFCEYIHAHTVITQKNSKVLPLIAPLTHEQQQIHEHFRDIAYTDINDLLPSLKQSLQLEYGYHDIQIVGQAITEHAIIQRCTTLQTTQSDHEAAQTLEYESQLQRSRVFTGTLEEIKQRQLEVDTLRAMPPIVSMYTHSSHIIHNLVTYLKHETYSYVQLCNDNISIVQFLRNNISSSKLTISKRSYAVMFESYYNNSLNMHRATHAYFLLSPVRTSTILKYIDQYVALYTQQQQLYDTFTMRNETHILDELICTEELRTAILHDYINLIHKSVSLSKTLLNAQFREQTSTNNNIYITYEDMQFIALFYMGVSVLHKTDDTLVQEAINTLYIHLKTDSCHQIAYLLRELDENMKNMHIAEIFSNSYSYLAILMFSQATLVRLMLLHLCALQQIQKK